MPSLTNERSMHAPRRHQRQYTNRQRQHTRTHGPQYISRHALATKTSMQRRWAVPPRYRRGGPYREHTGQGGPNGSTDRAQSRALAARLSRGKQTALGDRGSRTPPPIGHAVVGCGPPKAGASPSAYTPRCRRCSRKVPSGCECPAHRTGTP